MNRACCEMTALLYLKSLGWMWNVHHCAVFQFREWECAVGAPVKHEMIWLKKQKIQLLNEY